MRYRSRALRKIPICLFTVVVSACSAPGYHASTADGHLDGLYQGTRSQDASCGTAVDHIRFHVSGSQIWVPRRGQNHSLDGTVDADGRIVLKDPSGVRLVEGSIGEGGLTATELVGGSGNSKHRKSGVDDPGSLSCLWRFQAVRVPDGTAGQARSG